MGFSPWAKVRELNRPSLINLTTESPYPLKVSLIGFFNVMVPPLYKAKMPTIRARGRASRRKIPPMLENGWLGLEI
jgi:hypothetical protein